MKHTNYKAVVLKKILINLSILLLITGLFDFVAGSVLRKFYFRQQRGEDFRTTYSIEKTNEDIIIFGSSRGARQYHPDVFEKRLGLSYYNASREGNFMLYHGAVLQSILQRYTPKLVILDFRYGEFKKSAENYDRLSCLLPYYKAHPEMRQIIEQRGSYEKVKLLSSIYPFNSLPFRIAVRNMPFYKEERPVNKGYIFYDKVYGKPMKKSNDPAQYSLDTNIVKCYESFLQSCVSRNIRLLVVVTPYFSIKNKNDTSIKLAVEIARRHNVKFIDYSQDSFFLNRPELIADPIHLNNNGAVVLSNMLVDSLNNENEIQKERQE